MKLRNRKLDGLIRRIVPSTATLSYNTVFKILGYVNDKLIFFLIPEFRSLPPNHLRVRVGVGNKLFNNQAHCLMSGYNFWIDLFARRICTLSSNITEIGCGYGRKAIHLKNYSMQGEKFNGSYHGVDIDSELLANARKKFESAPEFSFQLSPHASKTYSADGLTNASKISESCRIDRKDNSQDLVFSTSLFTHLLEAELLNYVSESFRILKPGGTMQMNIFLYEFLEESGNLGSRFNFKHNLGNSLIESTKFPEAAVAYKGDYLVGLCKGVGFKNVVFRKDTESNKMVQSFLVCEK